MTDMLVKLYALPPQTTDAVAPIIIRRALAPEKYIITGWVNKHFNAHWASEVDVSFANTPVSCFVATEADKLLGFACYDATCKAFFGPTGVAVTARGRGAGKALLLACLHDMYAQGYAYGIIGGVGPVEFYQRTVSATVIEDSTPGIYAGFLRPEGNLD